VKRSVRRSQITAAVGKNGSGKTLALVERVVVPALAEGRPVLSNITVFASTADAHLPPGEREPHRLWIPYRTPAQLLEVEGAAVVIDEIQSAFSSRESSKMPSAVLNALLQLRHRDNVFAWSAPSWKRADTIIREVTIELILCSGHLPKKVPGQLWGDNRLFRLRFFDAEDFEEFSLSSAKSQREDTLRPVRREWYWRPRHDAHQLYDSTEDVKLFEGLDEFGTCIVCHGSRPRPKCSCARGGVLPKGGGEAPPVGGASPDAHESAVEEGVPLAT